MATWGEMGTASTHGGSGSLSGDPGLLMRDAPGARPSVGAGAGAGTLQDARSRELALDSEEVGSETE